jgi:hypothetical protein
VPGIRESETYRRAVAYGETRPLPRSEVFDEIEWWLAHYKLSGREISWTLIYEALKLRALRAEGLRRGLPMPRV